MIKFLFWLTAPIAVILLIATCDNYSHNSIVNTPPANYVNLISTNTYGGSGYDWGAAIATTADNEYVISGSTTSSGYGENTLYLARVGTDGSLTWQKAFGGPGDDNGAAVAMIDDSTIITAGVTTSFDLATGKKIDLIHYVPPGDHSFYVVKTNEDGFEYWEKAYGDTLHKEYATSVAVSASGYLIAGYQIKTDDNEEFYLVKLNEDGEALWQMAHGTSDMERAYAATTTSDGGFVVAGFRKQASSAASDPYLVKFSSGGGIVWERAHTDATNNERLYSVIQSRDGGIVAAGVSFVRATSENVLYVMKLNSAGVVQWEHTYSQSGISEGRCILEDSDGALLVCGQNSSANAIQITKISSAGEFMWSDASGASGYGTSMARSENRWVITGSTAYPDHSELNNVLLIKIEEDLTNLQ